MPVIHLNADQEAEVSREQLLEAAKTLPFGELDQFIDELFTARAKRYAPVLPAEEAALLEEINRCGLSPSSWERFHELQARQEAETITEIERSEYLQLVEQLEELNVKRIEALAKLSKLRGVPLPELMESLGLKPPGYV